MKKLIIIGLGSGDYKQLTLSAVEQLKSADILILRTEKHPTVDYIRSLGISFTTCDDIYDTAQTFEATYSQISERIMQSCQEDKVLVYAVPGHPMVAEKSVELTVEKGKGHIEIEIVPAVSFIDSILTALQIDPAYGLKIIDGLSLDFQKPDFQCGNIITQVYSRFVASEIKLKLMELYKDDTEIYIIKAAGVKGLERIEKHPLYELDRIDWVDYLTSVYIPPVGEESRFKTMDELVALMAKLRGEGGCPWDREQTRDSLKPYLLEETYEVLDAIEKNDIDLLIEEFGDLLLQVVFHAQIAKEAGEFDINDIITGIVNKLVKRHPHVFGDVIATTESGALKSWEASKRKLKGIDTYTQTLVDIPEALPNLMRSYKVQQKAALVGFDWDDVKDAIAKVDEELEEVKEVYNTGNKQIIEEEIGDLLFAVVNVARFLKIQPELALRGTIDKFIKRFQYIEETGLQSGKKIDKMTLQEMDQLWNQAKTIKILQK
ncbi:MAG: nucleoside triphosphate pyrophosphohydrolase [Clostridiales bacterium GWB2_37_7]|nr:MAG: nucleoside triphosphate pyrophosphohydrolase [Clostridiales bacterium GWB2_37_7]